MPQVVELNGGSPPLTFGMFNHVVQTIGSPDRPVDDIDLTQVRLVPEKGLLSNEVVANMRICQG